MKGGGLNDSLIFGSGDGHDTITKYKSYASAMDVDPRVQGKGNGAVLFVRSLSVRDETCRLAYLESTNPTDIAF